MTFPIDTLGRPPVMKPIQPKGPDVRPALRCEDKDGRAVVYLPSTGPNTVTEDKDKPITMPMPPWGVS